MDKKKERPFLSRHKMTLKTFRLMRLTYNLFHHITNSMQYDHVYFFSNFENQKGKMEKVEKLLDKIQSLINKMRKRIIAAKKEESKYLGIDIDFPPSTTHKVMGGYRRGTTE